MTIENTKKLAAHIIRLLKVDEIVFPIARTSKGNFGIRFGKNTDEYEMYLDSIPLSIKNILEDENNIELKRMLDKYLFEHKACAGERVYTDSMKINLEQIADLVDDSTTIVNVGKIVDANGNDRTDEFLPPMKKRGRPVGSKNGKKAD